MKDFICWITALLLWSCDYSKIGQTEQTSMWLNLKDSFAIKNVTEFKLDKGFHYGAFHDISCKLIDSTLPDQWCKAYLYSWQERDSSLIEFTVVVQEEDRGIQIIYYVFNKQDSLVSATPVAWGNISDLAFTGSSKFISKDTLRSTIASTFYERNGSTKGDTSIIEIAFNKSGKTSKKTISEKKELKSHD